MIGAMPLIASAEAIAAAAIVIGWSASASARAASAVRPAAVGSTRREVGYRSARAPQAGEPNSPVAAASGAEQADLPRPSPIDLVEDRQVWERRADRPEERGVGSARRDGGRHAHSLDCGDVVGVPGRPDRDDGQREVDHRASARGGDGLAIRRQRRPRASRPRRHAATDPGRARRGAHARGGVGRPRCGPRDAGAVDRRRRRRHDPRSCEPRAAARQAGSSSGCEPIHRPSSGAHPARLTGHGWTRRGSSWLRDAAVERDPLYASVADIVIDTTEASPEASVRELRRRLEAFDACR